MQDKDTTLYVDENTGLTYTYVEEKLPGEAVDAENLDGTVKFQPIFCDNNGDGEKEVSTGSDQQVEDCICPDMTDVLVDNSVCVEECAN